MNCLSLSQAKPNSARQWAILWFNSGECAVICTESSSAPSPYLQVSLSHVIFDIFPAYVFCLCVYLPLMHRFSCYNRTFASWSDRLFQGVEDALSWEHTRGAAGFSPAIWQPLRIRGPVRIRAQLQHLLPEQEGPAAALAAVPERWVCPERRDARPNVGGGYTSALWP